MAKSVEHTNPELAHELEAEAEHLLSVAFQEADHVTTLIADLRAQHAHAAAAGGHSDETSTDAHDAEAAPAHEDEASDDHAALPSNPNGLVLAGAEPASESDDPHTGGSIEELIDDLGANWEIFLLEVEEVRHDEELGLAFEAGQAILGGESEEAFKSAIADVAQIRDLLEADAAASAQQADQTYTSARTLTLVLIVAALAIAAVVGLLLARSISSGISRIAPGHAHHCRR